MFHALARFCRHNLTVVVIFGIFYAPLWYSAIVILVERYSGGIPLANAFLAPHVAAIEARWFHHLTFVCVSIGSASVGFHCWLRSLR